MRTNKLLHRLAEQQHLQWCILTIQIASTENISKEKIRDWQKLWKPYPKLPSHIKQNYIIYANNSLEVFINELLKIESKELNNGDKIQYTKKEDKLIESVKIGNYKFVTYPTPTEIIITLTKSYKQREKDRKVKT